MFKTANNQLNKQNKKLNEKLDLLCDVISSNQAHSKKMFSSILECDFCNLLLMEPISMQCGHTVCRDHLNPDFDEIPATFVCPFCQETQIMPKNGIRVNERLQAMLKSYNDNPERLSIKQDLEDLKNTVEEYEMIVPELFVHDYIAKLLNKVDLHREEVIAKIDECYFAVIEFIKKKEEQCKNNLPNVVKHNTDGIKKIVEKFEHSFRKVNSEGELLSSLHKDIKYCNSLVLNKKKTLEDKLLLGASLFFEKENDLSFGHLIETKNGSMLSKAFGQTSKCLSLHSGCITSMDYLPKKKILISASTDNTLNMWDITTGNCLTTFRKMIIESVLVVSDTQFITCSLDDKKVRLWDCNNMDYWKEMTYIYSPVYSSCLFSEVAIALGCEDGSIILVDLINLNQICQRTENTGIYISSMVYSKVMNGLICCAKNVVRLYRFDDSKLNIADHREFDGIEISNCAITEEEDYIILCGSTRCIKVFKWDDQKVTFFKSRSPAKLAKTLTEGLIAAGLLDGTIELFKRKPNTDKFDVESVKIINAHFGCIFSLCFIENSMLISGDVCGQIKIFNIFEEGKKEEEGSLTLLENFK